MKTIAFDVDGVLVDVSGLICEEWRDAGITINGESPEKRHVTKWEYRDIPGISDGELAHEIGIDRVFTRSDLYDGFAPLPGVIEALDTLRGVARCIAISHPTIGHADSKLRFLRELGFEAKDTFLATDKNSIAWNIIVEDGPHHALAALGANRRVVVLRQPWNAGVKLLDGVRVNTWADVQRELESFVQESALLEADRLIHGARQGDYDHPLVDFRRQGTMISGLLQEKLVHGEEVTARDVASIMIIVKLSRLQATPGHRDSIVDIAGYAGCYEMVEDRLEKESALLGHVKKWINDARGK